MKQAMGSERWRQWGRGLQYVCGLLLVRWCRNFLFFFFFFCKKRPKQNNEMSWCGTVRLPIRLCVNLWLVTYGLYYPCLSDKTLSFQDYWKVIHVTGEVEMGCNLKGKFSQKWTFCHLLTLMSFQTCKTFLQILNTNEDTLNEIWEISVPPLTDSLFDASEMS